MAAKFTQKYLASIKATGKVQWLTDAGFKNLRLYVGAAGNKTFFVSYRDKNGKKSSYKLGSADILTVAEAQDKAHDFLARLAKGDELDKRTQKKLQLGEFIEKRITALGLR